MQVEIKLDASYDKPKLVIYTDRMTDEVNSLLKKLSCEAPAKILIGFHGEQLEILQPEDLIRIYAENQKVIAQTECATYNLHVRLYEAEMLVDQSFIRISNSEIINLKKVKNMDLSFSGTICVNLYGDIRTFVSRRYVSKIKQKLGI